MTTQIWHKITRVHNTDTKFFYILQFLTPLMADAAAKVAWLVKPHFYFYPHRETFETLKILKIPEISWNASSVIRPSIYNRSSVVINAVMDASICF